MRIFRRLEALFSLGIDGIEYIITSRIYYNLIMYFLINNCIKFFNAKFTFIYLLLCSKLWFALNYSLC
jgi:ABC-type transporter Mla maintaining outer membrane lipid asymmetry permease subunit MlaE